MPLPGVLDLAASKTAGSAALYHPGHRHHDEPDGHGGRIKVPPRQDSSPPSHSPLGAPAGSGRRALLGGRGQPTSRQATASGRSERAAPKATGCMASLALQASNLRPLHLPHISPRPPYCSPTAPVQFPYTSPSIPPLWPCRLRSPGRLRAITPHGGMRVRPAGEEEEAHPLRPPTATSMRNVTRRGASATRTALLHR